jgi:hypothetical protein
VKNLIILGTQEEILDILDQNKTETAKFRLYSDVKHELDI